MGTATYGQQFQQYPIWTTETGDSFEGATKRFKSFPTPHDVFTYSLLGLPKTLPLTKEVLTPDDCAIYLENAITEIEMATSMDLTPVEHFQSFDYISGMFENNFMGLRLERWPATQISTVRLKFPHTMSITVAPGQPHPPIEPGQSFTYQVYTIPAGWIYLQRNKMNIVAAFGAIDVATDQASVATAGGIFSYITGFGRGAFQPGLIEVVYTAGYTNDHLPSTVHDLVVTLASIRFLESIFMVLLPFNSVTVSIDGVSQSATVMLSQLLQARIQGLQAQYDKKLAAIRGHFGQNIKMSFIGA